MDIHREFSAYSSSLSSGSIYGCVRPSVEKEGKGRENKLDARTSQAVSTLMRMMIQLRKERISEIESRKGILKQLMRDRVGWFWIPGGVFQELPTDAVSENETVQ
ncbi:hypothetical protein BGZ60DRAFT_433046 [Tricladium varicosporioides]|nr:hypothetical protein BGZ60DRAFT_433046 [Hymenoscyphus varicosporioides]